MKMKKLVSLLLAGAMTMSMAACGDAPAASNNNSDATSKAPVSVEEKATDDVRATALANGETLTLWTWTDDMKAFAEHYEEATGIHVEVVNIPTADYPTVLQTSFGDGTGKPEFDLCGGEPQMLGQFFDAGIFEDLSALGADAYADQIVDYVWQVGQDADHTVRAISYQITPAGFYYRRDIAEKVFGFSEPEKVAELFSSYEKITETGRTLKEQGYRIFASDAELSYFSGDSAWVIDGKLNVSPAREEFMDMSVQLYQEDLTAYAAQWATPWYQAMAGEVPVLTAELQGGDWSTNEDGSVALNIWDAENFNANVGNYTSEMTEVFAYGLPAWGVLIMRDHVADTTAGKWGVCPGPAYGFGGGTYMGISSISEHKDLAWDFIKFCTLNEETADWWIEKSQGDTVSLKAALEKHKDDENPVYGNQKMYSMWLELAEGIDYSKVTKYDDQIGKLWGNAISQIKLGDKSKEDAINEFYEKVESTFAGEIEVVR